MNPVLAMIVVGLTPRHLRPLMPRLFALARARSACGNEGVTGDVDKQTRGSRPSIVALIARSIALTTAWVAAACVSGAVAHDAHHSDLDDWYSNLKRPGTTVSCCNTSDCHGTQAEYRPDGWWARYGRPVYRTDPTGRPYVSDWILLDFVHVPETAILRKHDNPTGEAIICHSRPIVSTGQGVTVYCFVPPSEG